VQDLRRSNFTAADCRRCNFKNTNLQGSYFIKSVVPSANFEVGPPPVHGCAVCSRELRLEAVSNAVVYAVVLTLEGN
jgi:uncharacterized protein YjbI with pentapeptide repeats